MMYPVPGVLREFGDAPLRATPLFTAGCVGARRAVPAMVRGDPVVMGWRLCGREVVVRLRAVFGGCGVRVGCLPCEVALRTSGHGTPCPYIFPS
jgi:hypothetical protein